MRDKFLKYYLRKEIQEKMLELAEDREIAPRYGQGFGRRPDVLTFIGDVKDMAKKGATSFHVSEERWSNPLQLKAGMTKRELDANRKGWDLILDIDTVHWNYAKLTAYFLIEAIKFHDVKNVSCKFSVTGDTPILIREGRNIELLAIRKVIKKIKEKKKLDVLSLDKNNKLKYARIYDYIAHKDEVFQVFHTNSKLPLKVTKHHSVFCWDQGFIIQKKVEELKEGDHLISFRKTEIKREKPYLIHEFSYNKKKIKRKIEITKDLMRLIGYYLSEGHATKSINQVGFTFNVNEKKYINDCKNIIKTLYKNKKICERHPNQNSHQIVVHSKEFYTLIKSLCKDKKEKKMPNFVWHLPKVHFIELLRGYIRGDGHKKGQYSIAIKSVALQLTTQLVWLCKLNGISCNLGFEKNKEHELLQGNKFKESYVHIIHIPKSEIEMQEFNVKRNKFSPYPNDKLLPVDGLKEVFKQCKPEKFLKHRKEQMTLKKKQANLRRIQNVIDWFKNYKTIELNLRSKSIIENYKKAIKGDITTVTVKKISYLKKTIVYDVSVEETERFFGNYYPILLHNSGNKGFHIGIPFESFPDEVNGVNIKDWFPEGPRIITEYLENMIWDMLANKILEKENITDIAKKIEKPKEELMKNGKFNPFVLVDIDTILISNRHLFRSVYSLHEKSMLASVPIPIDKIMEFEKVDAEPDNIKTSMSFLDRSKSVNNDAKQLLIQAFDWHGKKNAIRGSEGLVEVERKMINVPKNAIAENHFPKCIEKILEGKMEDGKKRALFVLINFLKSMNWRHEDMVERLKQWNKSNKQPLSPSYFIGQMNWHKKQKESILPPNCSNNAYYKDLGIACESHICEKFKNPVNCAKRSQWIEQNKKPVRKVKKVKKVKKKVKPES
ncbi:MAG: hypothetical protein ISS01_00990 [Nanoarchaeota archaeon]|nr:hypothetical protein [Nanoarchaeota archaeon]